MSYFGTDGIRGRFGVFPITPDFVMALGYVTGQVLVEQNGHHDNHGDKHGNKIPSVLIGKDTRLSGYVIEAALQAGFNAAGVDVYMLGPLPTPAIAHLTHSFHADIGVVISASHNSFEDNGIKFFSSEGKKISDDMQENINAKLDALMQQQAQFYTQLGLASLPSVFISTDAKSLGKNHRIDDAKGRYIEYCKGTFPYQLSLDNLTIVVDCANGAGYGVAPRVFRELGARVVAIHHEPNGVNINADCGSTHPKSLQEQVLAHKADVGIALDGDGDRIIMVDHTGSVVDGDGILYVLALQGDDKPDGVVGTLMTNMALELALAEQGIEFIRAKVGDRYVSQELEARGWQLGGESSGHIICLDKSSTGDALVAALQVLALMVAQDKSLAQLLEGFKPWPQILVNVRPEHMQDPYQLPTLVNRFDQANKQLAGRGRLLIRKSGTEPIIRVMVESDDEIECDVLANELAELIKTELA